MTGPIARGLVLLAVGFAVAGSTGLIAHRLRPRGRWRLTLLVPGCVTVGALVAGALVLAWGLVAASGDRSPRRLELARGIDYRRVPVDEPRPQVLHLAVVDLDDPCLGLTTTIPDAEGVVTAETGTGFLERSGATLSVNVAYFYPIQEYPYWDAYPGVGDPVTAIGPVVVDGVRHGRPEDDGWGRALTIIDGIGSAGPTSTSEMTPTPADFSVPGREQLIADGRLVAPASDAYPRTVAGIDRDRNELVLVVSDGKQPGYAEGSTYREVAELLVGHLRVDEAIELDGGGSATMAGLVDDRVELLSRPSQQRIPGRERPVATHLGVVVDPACR